MNYEDRTDLKDPRDVLSSTLVATLSLVTAESGQIQDTFSKPAQVSDVAKSAFDKKAQTEASMKGAPQETRKVCLAMLTAGYNFATLLLPSLSIRATSPEILLQTADSMDVYGLKEALPEGIRSKYDGRALQEELVKLIGDDHQYLHSLEEAATEYWWLGVAIALVEHDPN